ncbi:hypothetical protein KIN20_020546 [Parelaphostrongylus tenuis]|uniref:Uncharacterized protein n=1 Tax=Parelaphostrongylus tenuis TaxID=148309 RepID=A0AAD5QTU0_PARTN|nr:hypothetical protein KIN20_020546 [Parelaphostrongylus tenuis]
MRISLNLQEQTTFVYPSAPTVLVTRQSRSIQEQSLRFGDAQIRLIYCSKD